MSDYKQRYDIFISGGSDHFESLKELLPRLCPFGQVHLASSFLTTAEQSVLSPYCDVIHEPAHHKDGYINFNLFCIRDINRLATAAHFIKLDADVHLRDGWVNYVDDGLESHPDTILFGVIRGLARINVAITGTSAERELGHEVNVKNGEKVIGGFYVGQSAFFKKHDDFMQAVHKLLFNTKEGEPGSASSKRVDIAGDVANLRTIGDEDTLRSLIIHSLGESHRMRIIDPQSMIRVPHGPGFMRSA